jgi:CDP-glucose 4,6-dehydratase
LGQRRGALEDVAVNTGFWRDRSVFVTGHTGFKGSWLALCLHRAGARVHGYALVPPTTPNLFTVADVAASMSSHTLADVRDAGALRAALAAAAPEVVFHLAAQPLVRHSYAAPVETFEVNVLGTVQLFEAVRACPSVRTVINVTTDKCYQNDGDGRAYREGDPIGGHDPYAASKACSELVTASYRSAFLAAAGVAVASARAGNVIGGGDWAADRLVPDVLRASDAGQPVTIRNPAATRPWQHVLDPLSGYMTLAERLLQSPRDARLDALAGAWNFGPGAEDARPVAWLLDHLAAQLPGSTWRQAPGSHPHEAPQLQLDSAKARTELGWQPRWRVGQALERTVEWHQAWRRGAAMRGVCLAQIAAHEAAALQGVPA